MQQQLKDTLPYVTAGLAFAWGFVAGTTALAASKAGAIDFSLGILIATIPIAIGAFINVDRKLRLSEGMNRRLQYEQVALHEHCIVSMTDERHELCYVNDKLLELTGYTRDELVGRSASVLYSEADADVFRAIRAKLNAGELWEGETRMRRKDGSAIWTHATMMPQYDAAGKMSGTISVRTDITGIKLATSQRQLFAALHKISDEVYVFEPETYRFVYMNEHAMNRFGWNPATYQAKSLQDAEPRFEKQRFDRLVEPLLDGSVDRILMQVALGGKPHDVTIHLTKSDVGPPRFVAIFRDVSDRAEVERIKDEFIATVSHELRSPLTSIKGALGLILSGAIEDLSERSRSLLEIAHRNADRLVLIVNDILDLEKIAAGMMTFDKQVADLDALVAEAIAANSSGAARFDVEIVADKTEAHAFAAFDHARMMQVMTNLLSNAMKFSHPGGKVIVSLETSGDMHVISVRDFGVGIPPEALEKVFDRFVQAANKSERTGNGTGLGLSIVKAIVENHDGTLSIESEVNKGTSVHIRLPKAKALPELADGTHGQ